MLCSNASSLDFDLTMESLAGVIVRGLKFLSILGALPPNIFMYLAYFSKVIDLASNVLYSIDMMNFLPATWLLRSF